jgi:hypothetical protein
MMTITILLRHQIGRTKTGHKQKSTPPKTQTNPASLSLIYYE